MDGIVAAPLDRFRALLQRAGIDEDKPLYAVLVTVFEAAQNTREIVQDSRQPVRDDELRRAVIQGMHQHANGAIRAMNLRTSLLAGAALAIAFAAGVGAKWWVTPVRPLLQCQTIRGGVYCGQWQTPPTEQPDAPQTTGAKPSVKGK